MELTSKVLLTKSDTSTIANNLGITKDQVNKVKRSDRGKRKTTIQERVKKALMYRSKQNKALVQYCEQLKVTCVAPK